jgi:teichuronic acid exporter
MLAFNPLRKLKSLVSSRYAKNLGWLGGAELINRIFRLATTITLIRVFSKSDYGTLSAIYTTFEFMLAFSLNEGIGSKILQAEPEDVEEVANSVYWMNWILMGSIFLLQCAFAYPIALFYKNPGLVGPLCLLGLCYLQMPTYMVHDSLLARDNRLEVRAWGVSGQAILANILIVILVPLGYGVWGVVWSMVLTYPVWTFLMYRNHPWRPKRFSLTGWRSISQFGFRVLGVELLNRIRMNVDYVIVAGLMGTEALGLYFFAFNAGLGISQSVLWSIASTWYPEFCEVRSDLTLLRQKCIKTFKTIGMIIVPMVILQVSLAWFYIPILAKGDKWNAAIPIVMIICLSAIPLAIARSTSHLLRALDQIRLDLIWNTIFVGIFSVSILAAVLVSKRFFGPTDTQSVLISVAVTVLVTQALMMPAFTWFVDRKIFGVKAMARSV